MALVEEGYNYRQVGDRMDISSSVASRAYNRYLETGDYQRRVGQGRRRATNPRVDRAIVRRVRQEPFVPANVVARNFPNRRQQQPRNISVQTVRNRLRETEVRSRSAARVPMLSPMHRRARLAYARQHVHWTARQWNNVLFSDECRVCLF